MKFLSLYLFSSLSLLTDVATGITAASQHQPSRSWCSLGIGV